MLAITNSTFFNKSRFFFKRIPDSSSQKNSPSQKKIKGIDFLADSSESKDSIKKVANNIFYVGLLGITLWFLKKGYWLENIDKNLGKSTIQAFASGSIAAFCYFPLNLCLALIVNRALKNQYSEKEHKIARKRLNELIDNKQITTSDILIKAPILEEMIFREFLQKFTSPLISSILFGYAHTLGDKSLRPITKVQAIVAGLSGYNLLAPIYANYGLIGSIAAHFTNNLLAHIISISEKEFKNYFKKKKVDKISENKKSQSNISKIKRQKVKIFKDLKFNPFKKQKYS